MVNIQAGSNNLQDVRDEYDYLSGCEEDTENTDILQESTSSMNFFAKGIENYKSNSTIIYQAINNVYQSLKRSHMQKARSCIVDASKNTTFIKDATIEASPQPIRGILKPINSCNLSNKNDVSKAVNLPEEETYEYWMKKSKENYEERLRIEKDLERNAKEYTKIHEMLLKTKPKSPCKERQSSPICQSPRKRLSTRGMSVSQFPMNCSFREFANSSGDGTQVRLVDENGDILQVNPKSQLSTSSMTKKTPRKKSRILPDDPNYDPLKDFTEDESLFVKDCLKNEFNSLYYHRNLENNDVMVPRLQRDKEKTFFVIDNNEESKLETELQIRKLGGKIVDMRSASRIVYVPTHKALSKDDLFMLLIAAVSGKRLLPLNFIRHSVNRNHFGNVRDFDKLDGYQQYAYTDDHIAAFQMNLHIRSLYAKGALPPFYMQHILFYDKKNEHKDVILLLQILGAYVQPIKKTDTIDNGTVTMMVTDQHAPRPYNKVVPLQTPREIRTLLWNEFEKFRKKDS